MPKQIKSGFTDYTTTVFIPDPASTDGSGKTGLVAANLTVSGTRVETDNDVTVTDYTSSLNDLAALTTAHTDWGLKEISSTLAPGLYRLDIADAIFASGAWTAVVYVMITSSAAAASPIEFELVAYDQNDGVRLGLTALPNAAADAAGGLIISDAGGLDADAQRSDVAAILVDTGTTLDARIPAALVGGRMDSSVGAMAANVITAAATASDYLAEINAEADTAIADAALATAAALATVDTVVDAILVDTNELQTDWANGGRLDLILDARASQTSVDTIDDFLDTEIAASLAILVKLDNTLELTSDGYVFNSVALQQVWDEPIAGHLASGSTGAALNAAGTAGDPWTTTLPGAYGAGTAGFIVGTNIDALISSRASQASLNTLDDLVDTEVGAIKAVTDKLDTTLFATTDGYAFTANSLEFAPSGSGPSASAIADEVQTRTIAAVTTVNGLANNSVTAAALAADAVTEIQSGLATSAALATVDTVVDAILLDTAEIGAAGAGLSAIPWNAAWDAEVQSECADALNAYDPPTNAEMVARTLAAADYATATDLAAVPTALENADALLNRDMSAVSDTEARSPLNALRFLRNKWSIAGTTLTVTKEDDTASAWTATVSTSAGADPVVGNDPA